MFTYVSLLITVTSATLFNNLFGKILTIFFLFRLFLYISIPMIGALELQIKLRLIINWEISLLAWIIQVVPMKSQASLNMEELEEKNQLKRDELWKIGMEKSNVVVFEDEIKGPWAKKYRQSVEARRGYSRSSIIFKE